MERRGRDYAGSRTQTLIRWCLESRRCLSIHRKRALIDANPRFAAMTSAVKTTQTLGVQPGLAGSQRCWAKLSSPVVIPHVEPLDTGDMTHLLSHESWPAGSVKNLAYDVRKCKTTNRFRLARSWISVRQTGASEAVHHDSLTKDIEALAKFPWDVRRVRLESARCTCNGGW